jgi:spore coat protein CotH
VSNLKRTSHILALCFISIFIAGCGGSSAEKVVEPPIVLIEPVITDFSFLVMDNPNLANDIKLSISGKNITGRVSVEVDLTELVASVQHTGTTFLLDDEAQVNRSSMNDFTDIRTYTIVMDDNRQATYTIDITGFTGLPIVYLETVGNNPIVSKEDYVDGGFRVHGGRDFDDQTQLAMEIRGRGNSTWGHPKKPFQMKLNDKASVFGLPEAKKWLFLAEYSDKTMLRNTIAFEMGYLSTLDWTPKGTFAEVFINDQYNGTYNITEKVEESSGRVDLGDTGFLLEIDQLDRQDEDDVYFYTDKFLVAIKEPSLNWDDEQYLYIEAYINEFESVLFGTSYADPINGYAKYIDVDSFVDWYLISEITKNVDSQWFSSIYFNVIPGEKIKMGPLWDFDLSFGNVDYADPQFAEGFWVKSNPWFARLFKDPSFVAKVKSRFAYFKLNQNLILDKIDMYAERLKWAQQENDLIWGTIGVYVWPNPVVFDTYDEEIAHLKDWYTTRMFWLQGAFNQL